MIETRRITSARWRQVRAIRLEALRDSPDWFWATYDDEVTRSEEWWRSFIDLGAWFVAFEGERPVGVAAAIPDAELGDSARQLISMWVRPGARGRGVGATLVDGVADWARGAGLRELRLQVTDGNDGARRLYERCGFTPTGRTESLPRDPSVVEHEMRLRLDRPST